VKHSSTNGLQRLEVKKKGCKTKCNSTLHTLERLQQIKEALSAMTVSLIN